MSIPTFDVATRYLSDNNCLILLPFADKDTGLFQPDLCPVEIMQQLSLADKKGGRRCFFAGQLDGHRITAETVRLDAEHTSLQQQMKSAVASAIEKADEEYDCRHVIVFLNGSDLELISAVQEGALLGGYRFDKYLEKKPSEIGITLVMPENNDRIQSLLHRNMEMFGCVNMARDVLNEPPNVIHPESLAEYFVQHGRKAGLEMEVWEEERLVHERCNGILSVGKGAASRPRLVTGNWRHAEAETHLILVGKGVTFDTGGYCLKPGSSQIGMKYDMGGAAMMFASACAAARLELPVNITLLTPLVENDISGSAFHTTDIITMLSGKTVQVDNTDAEGRLILADALALAAEQEPDIIIDSATLTGACAVALGEDIAGLFSRDDELGQRLVNAGRQAGEWLWPMPLHMPYMEQLKATVADCKNLGDKWGGAITAALFLGQFVPDDIPWAHIDIAGPSVKEEPLEHLGKGAKGFGVKTMVHFISDMCSQQH